MKIIAFGYDDGTIAIMKNNNFNLKSILYFFIIILEILKYTF